MNMGEKFAEVYIHHFRMISVALIFPSRMEAAGTEWPLPASAKELMVGMATTRRCAFASFNLPGTIERDQKGYGFTGRSA